MSKKPTSLSAVMAKKPSAVPDPPAPEGEIKTMTLRVPVLVHDQIREMAFTSRQSQHSLVMEALNLLFERRGKPPIAPTGS